MGEVIEVPGVTEQDLREQILAEITAAYQQREQRPFEFTRQEFAEAAGMTYYKAARTLTRLVESGELRSDLANVNGKQSLVYWRPGDEESTGFPDVSTR